MQICLEILNIIHYWYNGSQSNDKYDTNTLDTDPGFINAANGDLL